jgi:hypothetical protein
MAFGGTRDQGLRAPRSHVHLPEQAVGTPDATAGGMRFLLPFLTVTILTACSTETGLNPISTTSATGTGGGSAALAITGSLIDTWRTDGGDLVLPRDPASVTLSALVQRSDGGWDTYVGSLDASGHFVIPHVPLGAAHVLVQNRDGGAEIRVTDARTLDLGWVRYGRPDLAASSKPPSIALQITGDASWDLGSDWEQVDSLSAGVHAAGNCAGGLDGCLLTSASGGLIDPSKGDEAWFTHHAHTTSGETSTTSVTHAFVSTTFSQGAGAVSTLSGTAMPVPQRQVAIAYDLGAFTALLDDAPAGSVVRSFSAAALYASNRVAALGVVGRSSLGGSTFDLTYGDPLPAGTPTTVAVWLEAQEPEAQGTPIPGSAIPTQVTFYITGSPADFAARTVAPLVSLPRAIRVNGEAGWAAGAGPSPVISWQAPAVGSAPLYHLYFKTSTLALDVFTRDTQVAIPAELLDVDHVDFWIAAEIGDYATSLQASAQVYWAGGFTR